MLRLTVVLLLFCGCRAVGIGAGPTLSSGSVNVGGIESGIGGAVELKGLQRTTQNGWAWAAGFDYGGYSSAADADLLLFVTGDGHYRVTLGQDGRWYTAFGAAAGYSLGVAGGEFIIAGRFELGLQFFDGGLDYTVSIVERPGLFISDGNPAAEFHNTLVLQGALYWSL